MRWRPVILGVASVGALSVGLAQFAMNAPVRMTHQLNAQCAWDRREWLKRSEFLVLLGFDISVQLGSRFQGPRYGALEMGAVRACMLRRGSHGSDGELRVILTRWPGAQ